MQTDEHAQDFGPLALPESLSGQPYIQLLWKYYYLAGDSGPRAELRLDEISLAGVLDLFEQVALVAQWWLMADCGLHGHCGGADINRDEHVNLIDFAVLAESWLELDY